MLRNALVASLLTLFALPLACHAQGGSAADEITRQVLPGRIGPYGGASPFERYHYGNVQPLNLMWDSRGFYDLEYLDRLERQEKFGHRWPSARYGSEFQVNRINNEYLQREERLDNRRVRFSAGGGIFFGRARWR